MVAMTIEQILMESADANVAVETPKRTDVKNLDFLPAQDERSLDLTRKDLKAQSLQTALQIRYEPVGLKMAVHVS